MSAAVATAAPPARTDAPRAAAQAVQGAGVADPFAILLDRMGRGGKEAAGLKGGDGASKGDEKAASKPDPAEAAPSPEPDGKPDPAAQAAAGAQAQAQTQIQQVQAALTQPAPPAPPPPAEEAGTAPSQAFAALDARGPAEALPGASLPEGPGDVAPEAAAADPKALAAGADKPAAQPKPQAADASQALPKVAGPPADANATTPQAGVFQVPPPPPAEASPVQVAQAAQVAQLAPEPAPEPARETAMAAAAVQPGAAPPSNAAGQKPSAKTGQPARTASAASPAAGPAHAADPHAADPTTQAKAAAPPSDAAAAPDASASDLAVDAAPGQDQDAQAQAQAQTQPQVQTDAQTQALAPAPGQAAGVYGRPEAAATPATASHLAAQMLRRIDGRMSRFDVQLDPAGLGQVRVSVEIDARGRLKAALNFDRPESAAALKVHAGALQAALEQAGFDLSGGGLSFEAGGGGLAQEGGDQAAPGRRDRAFDLAASAADQSDQAAGARLERRALRGLDIRI